MWGRASAIESHPDTMTPLAAWIFGVLMALAPPSRLAALPSFPGHEESEIERRSRYVAIAVDLDDVVHAEAPLPGGRKRTAAVLLGIA